MIEGDGVRLRRAAPGDTDFLVELLADDDVAPFLARVTSGDREEVLAEIQRSQTEPDEFGRFVIEIEDGGGW